MTHHAALLLIVIAIATLFALLIGAATAVLVLADGATTPAAILRAGIAFAGTMTLTTVILTLVLGELSEG
jgi:hypothetical protein